MAGSIAFDIYNQAQTIAFIGSSGNLLCTTSSLSKTIGIGSGNNPYNAISGTCISQLSDYLAQINLNLGPFGVIVFKLQNYVQVSQGQAVGATLIFMGQ